MITFSTARISVVQGLAALGLAVSVSVLAGCSGGGGSSLTPFERGFNDGFADDGLYFTGYDDSWFTIGFAPILYQGGDIPFIDDFTYDAGYFDGQFYAYNDGYFIAYWNAFIIGFSEGYDNAFAPDYLDFLAFDQHTEYLTGGFSDGYDDGFTEGRVFGAFDYEAFLPFDWLDALSDWESGTDLYFEEVDVGTGAFGPAILYVWGTDPNFLRSGAGANSGRVAVDKTKALRGESGGEDRDVDSRPLEATQQNQLDVSPDESSRTGRALTLTDTWLDRINSYQSSAASRDAVEDVATASAAVTPRIGSRVKE